MCTDLMENLCSEKRVSGLIQNVGDAKTLAEVDYWTRTAVASLRMIKKEYASFPDVVLPFVAGLTQVSKKASRTHFCSL